ncbi:MAG: PAS domain-containing protein, partial [Bacteroidota bacterium]
MDKSRQHFPHSSLELDKVLNALFHTTVEGILVVNENGEICMANQRSLNLLEYSEAELLNQPVEVLIPARVRAAHPHKTAGFFQNPNARVKGEGRFFPAVTAKGEELMLEISLDPVQTEEGIYVVVHLVDVSRQLRSEQELQESKIRLSSIIETAVDGIITISTEGIIETINPAAARLFGYTPEEVIGRNI